MTGQKLLDELLLIKEEYGTLDVEIDASWYGSRFSIDDFDIFTDGVDRHLYSLDLNISRHE